MRFDQESPWLVAVAFCSCTAMGIAAYGIGSGTLPAPLISGAVIALGLGLVISQTRSFFRAAQVEDSYRIQMNLLRRMDASEQMARDWQYGQDGLAQQMAALQANADTVNQNMVRGLEDIRASHAQITQQLEELMARPVPAPIPVPAPQNLTTPSFAPAAAPQSVAESLPLPPPPAAAPVAAAAATTRSEPSFTDKITLSLEPVIDLYTMQTAHYRMQASMLNDRGVEVAPDSFLHHAAQMGKRAEVDLFVVRETLAVLSRLRERDANLQVMTSIGAATLADPVHLRAILAAMMEYREVSQGIVFEVAHASLASLPDQSLEGLATLARAGVTLALSNASIAGVDLAALSKLNMRYITLAAGSLGLGEKPSAALGGFVQAARALRINIVITQVADSRQLQDLSRTARYAAGPAFAPPRRLKRVDEASPALQTAA